MAFWQKTIYLEPHQAELLREILDRTTRQTTVTLDKTKRAVGSIYMEDFRVDLEEYNLMVAVYDDLLANKNIVYEERGALNYVNSDAGNRPGNAKDVGLDERELEMLTEIVKSFVAQNNGVAACKLELASLSVDYSDYKKLKRILEGLA
jgi:hypothetical protein